MNDNSRRREAGSTPIAAPEFFSSEVVEARRFYLNLNPPQRSPLTVVCGGVETCAPDYAIHRASFPFYSIEYVVRGHGTLTLGNRKHTLMPGWLFSYGPGVKHDIQSEPSNPMVKYFVTFAGTKAAALLRESQLAPGGVSHIFPPHEAQGILDELISSGIRGTEHSVELCACLLECLLLKISDARAPINSTDTRAFKTFQQCRQHIQQHFLRLRTLDQLAGECHVDAAYLCRLFRRYDQQSPYQFLLRLKLNAAAELLKSPDALVKQVAQQIGFSDAFHFSRTFKSAFGLSPKAFRRLR